MKIINLSKNTVLAENAVVAKSLLSRLKGLLGRGVLTKGEGLIIPDCGSIHTFFMGFSIDVIFLDNHRRVTKIKKSVGPFRLIDCPFTGQITIELPIGMIDASTTDIGDKIDIQIA
ncbi:MAG: DUF192 domain-containing protein [Candidatus Omnitrophota bacterium]